MSHALTPSVVGERLKSEFLTPEENAIAASFGRFLPGRMKPIEQLVDMPLYHESELYLELIEPYKTPFISCIFLPGRNGVVSFGLGQLERQH